MRTIITLLLLAGTAAQAHVTLEEPRATAGAGYKAVLRVGHGCEGSPTHTLSVRLPAGFRGAKPMPKPGWAIAIERAHDMVQITWTAQAREAWLADAHYDEFVLRGQAPATPGPAPFQVLQVCEKGQAEWSVPLDVRPAAAAAATHRH